MEIQQVRYFLTLAKTLNFTRAAEECNVSQPALSRAIKQLEQELGGDLFRRERSLTHLTDLGRSVLPALRQCYDGSIAARHLADAYLKQGQAPLNLTLARSIEMELLLPLLGEVARAFPKIEIRISRGTPHELAERLKSGDAEVAISGPLGEEWERYDARRLFEEGFGLLVASAHAFAQRNIVDPAALEEERLLCQPQCGMAERITRHLQSTAGIKVARHEVPSAEDLSALVRANFGVGVVPLGWRMPGDLVTRQVEGIDLTHWVHVITVAGRPHSVGAATLIALLRARAWPPAPEAGASTGGRLQ